MRLIDADEIEYDYEWNGIGMSNGKVSEKEIDRMETFNLEKHDAELLDKVADRIHKKMCSENCGERQCVDSIDRCVWYWYVTEVIAELKAEVLDGE